VKDAIASITGATPLDRLASLRAEVAGRIVFTTSFGIEDQALTHMIFDAGLAIDVVTIDTGRLFPATYKLWAETEDRYARRIKPLYPNAEAVATFVADWGINGFYHATEARSGCCGVRKVEPLQRALAGASGWVTGMRADQSETRGAVTLAGWDETHSLVKTAPLFDWTREQVVAFVETEAVPISPLHAQGFLSIGCEPCTRAVAPDEPERAGRWWWESDESKECGLHIGTDGKLVRTKVAA
jgi:phosphoadenosine phosphosulfate reductase